MECSFRELEAERTRRVMIATMGSQPVSGWESVLSQSPEKKPHLSFNLEPPDQVNIRLGNRTNELTGICRLGGVFLVLRPDPINGISCFR